MKLKNSISKAINKSDPSTTRRAILLGAIVLAIIAVPFVLLVVWFVIDVLNVPIAREYLFTHIVPIATAISAPVLFFPVAFIWTKLFHEIDEQAVRAEKAQQKAEKLLEQRAEFVAYISHELRTPLNGIIGLSDALSLEDLNHDQQECVEMIQESSQELLTMLNDLLDMSQIEEGQVALQPNEVSLHKAIHQIYNFWKPKAKEKGLELKLSVCETFPDIVKIDILRFRQVAHNLVSNAIKYSDSGTVTISADCEYVKQLALFSVSDTGLGIPKEMRDLIFEPYQRIEENHKNAKLGKLGTGLGLPISRRLARLMNGDLILSQSSKKGSRFTFSFQVELVDTSVTKDFLLQ